MVNSVLTSLFFIQAAVTADFSFIMVPDVHINGGTGAGWIAQANWIVANKTALNIQGVFSVGDFTSSGYVPDIANGWTQGFQAIDGLGIPYGVAIGNHDYDSDNPSGRLSTTFDAQLGYARISGKTWFGGAWTDPNGQHANEYILFTEPTTSRKFLVLFLELYPRPGALAWATGVIAANPGREVLVFTHAYQQDDTQGTLADRASTFGPKLYGLPSVDASGVDIEVWAATQPVRAVFCGHWINGATHGNIRTDTAVDGHKLYGIFSNWQAYGVANGPVWVLLLQFTSTTVAVSVIQTTNGTTRTDTVGVSPHSLPWAAGAPAASQSTTIPVISANGVVNGASFQPGLVPGSWATIEGTNLASVTDNWDSSIVNGTLPTTLDGVTVTVGGQKAYLYYVSPSQINFVVPNLASGPTQVTVANSAGTSAALTVTSSLYRPAFFTWPGSQAVATRQDFSLAVKDGTFAGAATVPAKPGDVIILWGTGFGPTTPAAPIGVQVPGNLTYSTSALPTVTINNIPARVYGAALAPGFAGLYQVAIQLPSSLVNGDWPVVASISGVQSPPTTLSVQQ